MITKLILNEGDDRYQVPSVTAVAKWLEHAVQKLQDTEFTLFRFGLKHPCLDFMVGWANGYDIDDNSVIHDSISPSFGINAGVKVHTSDMGPDFEFYNFPYEDNGPVWDAAFSIAPNEDYQALAQDLIDEFNKMKDLELDWDGKILADTSEEPKEEPKEEEENPITKDEALKESADRSEIEAAYKAAYGKDLDWKSVPVVKFADKFLSGWGEAEGRLHTQVLLCSSSVEAANLEDYIYRNREEIMAGRIRRTFGVKFNPSAESYIIAANAPALGGTKDFAVKEEPEAKEDAPVEEAYIDTEDDSIKSYKYKDQTVYRIIATRMEGDRTQMFTIGTGTKLDDTEFEPVVRSARYTTEESFLWLDSVKAEKFLRRFKKEYPDVDMTKMHVAEYNPLYPIIKLVPISSPCGRAYLGVQDIPKEKLDAQEEKEKEEKGKNESLFTEGLSPNEMTEHIVDAILSYKEELEPYIDRAAINSVATIITGSVRFKTFIAEAREQHSGNGKYTLRVFLKFTPEGENATPFKIVLNGGIVLNSDNPNKNDKVGEYKSAMFGMDYEGNGRDIYIIFGPWELGTEANLDPFVDKKWGQTVYNSRNEMKQWLSRDYQKFVTHTYFDFSQAKSIITNAIDNQADTDADSMQQMSDEEFDKFYSEVIDEVSAEINAPKERVLYNFRKDDWRDFYIRRYKYWYRQEWGED